MAIGLVARLARRAGRLVLPLVGLLVVLRDTHRDGGLPVRRETSGTGRFAGATGTFSVTRMANNATHVSQGSIEGTIVLARGN